MWGCAKIKNPIKMIGLHAQNEMGFVFYWDMHWALFTLGVAQC
jgi:hypothetical protein